MWLESYCDHRDKSVVLLPNLNGGLLGDKVILSAVAQWFQDVRPDMTVIGIEGAEALSMKSYWKPPVEIRRGRITLELERAVDDLRLRKPSVLLLEDRNSIYWSRPIPSRLEDAYRLDMWAVLKDLAGTGVFPRLRVSQESMALASARLRGCLGASPEKYVTLHVRRLAREASKNNDEAMARKVARAIVGRIGCPVVIVGRGDQFEEVREEGVVDLRTAGMKVAELVGVLAGATVHIGGDSGPTHVAGAVGTALCCVDYETTRYGPFVKPDLLLARFGQATQPGIAKLDDWRQIVDVVAEAVLCERRSSRAGEVQTHENAA